MAEKLATIKDWDAHDRERMASAVAKISASPDLRFFLASLLVGFGYNQTPHATNAIEAARLAGRHSCAMDLIATILEHEPMLYPLLIKEGIEENALRNEDNYNA